MPDTPGPVIAALAATLLLGLILGMWLGEVMGRRLPRPTRLDLDAIEREHLTQCGAHDYGLLFVAGCQCPTGDPRPVIAQLVREVRRLAKGGRDGDR